MPFNNGDRLLLIVTNLNKLIIRRDNMQIKPTMSHAVNQEHLKELIATWEKEHTKETRQALLDAMDEELDKYDISKLSQ